MKFIPLESTISPTAYAVGGNTVTTDYCLMLGRKIRTATSVGTARTGLLRITQFVMAVIAPVIQSLNGTITGCVVHSLKRIADAVVCEPIQQTVHN